MDDNNVWFGTELLSINPATPTWSLLSCFQHLLDKAGSIPSSCPQDGQCFDKLVIIFI